MSPTEQDSPPGQDRRLSSTVHELEKSVQELKLEQAKQAIELGVLKGQQLGSATSFEVQSVTNLMNVKLDHLSELVTAIRAVHVWGTRLVVGAVILALLGLVLRQGS